MCLEIFRDAGKAFTQAAKRRKMGNTALVLVESAIMAAVAVLVITAKASSVLQAAVLGFGLNVFALVILIGIIGGFVIKVVCNALGAKGGFFEGLTALSYAFAPISAGLLIASVLTLIPLGIALGAIALAILIGLGLAVLYRGVKEMFRTDMITAFVAVSITTLAFIIALYASVGLNLLVNLGRLLPGI